MMKRFILYGILLAAATIALQVLQYKLVIINHSLELYGGILALIFTVVGIYAGRKLTHRKEVIIEKLVTVHAPAAVISSTVSFENNTDTLEKLGISKREYEILELMAHGHSNQEIADKIFVSVNTVKTHTSNLFLKLDVKRRTQAVKKAQDLNLIS